MVLASLALAGVVVLFFLFLGQRSANRELRAMVLSDRVDVLIKAGSGAEAEAMLEEAAELDPGTPDLWRRRAVVRMMTGQHFEAMTAAREHLKNQPNDAQVSTLLGAAQILTRDYDGADQTLTAALQVAPLHRDLLQNLSELRRLQKRPDEAAALIDLYLVKNPGDDFFVFKRAMADVAGDLPQERRDKVASAIQTGNASAAVYVVAAAIDFHDGKPEDAREKLRQAGKRAGAGDMQTMLQDQFFRSHIQAAATAESPAGGS